MKIKMQLLSDVIFGNGMSIPGAEDISVLCDENGFPYYKGGTFKGVFREELIRYLGWVNSGGVEKDGAEEHPQTVNDDNVEQAVAVLLGKSGDRNLDDGGKLVFSDFVLSDYVKKQMLAEIGENNKMAVLDALTNIRTFTSISEEGTTKDGSLRSCRCVNQGLYFYSEIMCSKENEELVEEVLSMIKWVGTMRNRGFGKVKIIVEK